MLSNPESLKTLAKSSLVLGVLMIAMSIFFMIVGSPSESGRASLSFVGGTIFYGSGLISLTRLATSTRKPVPIDAEHEYA
jgi:hypothetical protein